MILLPQFGQLFAELQLSNLPKDIIPALAECIMWAHLVKEHTGDEVLFRYIEVVLQARAGVGSGRANQVLAAMRSKLEAAQAQSSSWALPRPNGALDAVEGGFGRAMDAAGNGLSESMTEKKREGRGFGFRRS